MSFHLRSSFSNASPSPGATSVPPPGATSLQARNMCGCTCHSLVFGAPAPCKCSEIRSKLEFLQTFEPGPMSDSFRGDLEFVGHDFVPVYAHRFIMAGRSAVLRRMFESEMEEKETGVVKIADVGAPVLRAMVNFCYTANILFTTEAPAEEVLKVAHKYDIVVLKEVAENELSKGFTQENICIRLWLATLYGSTKLETESTKFVKQNFDTIFPIISKQVGPRPFGNHTVDRSTCEAITGKPLQEDI